MDRDRYHKMMQGEGDTSYEVYVNTQAVLSCQKQFDKLVNDDELTFQSVHQIEEVWMKLVNYTLLEIHELISERRTLKLLKLFDRCHRILRLMTNQLNLLETMSPYGYQEIREQLGDGSGFTSPGFNAIREIAPMLWEPYERHYLKALDKTVETIYAKNFNHCESYVVAEALIEFDELFQDFRYAHLQLVKRIIGAHTKSIAGRPIEVLKKGVKEAFYPGLWQIRSDMTDNWADVYGVVRDPLKPIS